MKKVQNDRALLESLVERYGKKDVMQFVKRINEEDTTPEYFTQPYEVYEYDKQFLITSAQNEIWVPGTFSLENLTGEPFPFLNFTESKRRLLKINAVDHFFKNNFENLAWNPSFDLVKPLRNGCGYYKVTYTAVSEVLETMDDEMTAALLINTLADAVAYVDSMELK